SAQVADKSQSTYDLSTGVVVLDAEDGSSQDRTATSPKVTKYEVLDDTGSVVQTVTDMTATRINTSTLTLGKNYTVRVTGADNDGSTTTGTYTLRVADTGPTTTV
ncbi:hypothetical protein, partial [Streptococcus suis]